VRVRLRLQSEVMFVSPHASVAKSWRTVHVSDM